MYCLLAETANEGMGECRGQGLGNAGDRNQNGTGTIQKCLLELKFSI